MAGGCLSGEKENRARGGREDGLRRLSMCLEGGVEVEGTALLGLAQESGWGIFGKRRKNV